MPLLQHCRRSLHTFIRNYGSKPSQQSKVPDEITLLGNAYRTDHMTNITDKIVSKVGANLQNQKHHPLNLIKAKIINRFLQYRSRIRTPEFTVVDNLGPVVTVQQNFDSLLTPPDHVSRKPSDTYYVNSEQVLRTHTSAHQQDLIRGGSDAFLVVGDVYRRDTVDASHYPVFHQMEGVKLFNKHKLFREVADPTGLELFESGGKETPDKQALHSLETSKLLEADLKRVLTDLAAHLFGEETETRWVEGYFPFTHPSWELEILWRGDWLEVLGCGVMRQDIIDGGGASDKVGWAFGLGLERLAMVLYSIPDIRLFWSADPGVTCQFKVDHPDTPITYKPVSVYPPCTNDLAAWVPDGFEPNDFYDLVRSVGGDLVEQVDLIDVFEHPKHKKTSHCYRIVYRSMSRTLTQPEVNELHDSIAETACDSLGFNIR